MRVVKEDGSDCKPGEAGEVAIRGRHIMKEYWNREEATAEAIRDGWFYSGDGATMDEDGFVYIQDRIKDMYISGGENVYPAEVENVLSGHDKIVEAGVIGQPSEKWGECGAAIVVRSDESLTEEEVLVFCQDKLARYKQPKGRLLRRRDPQEPVRQDPQAGVARGVPGAGARVSGWAGLTGVTTLTTLRLLELI